MEVREVRVSENWRLWLVEADVHNGFRSDFWLPGTQSVLIVLADPQARGQNEKL